MKLINKILDLVFPENIICIICGEDIFDDDNYSICNNCKSNLNFITGSVCECCGLPINSMAKFCDRCQSRKMYINSVRSCFVYKNEVATLIRNLKFNGKKYLAKNLGSFLVDLYKKQNFDIDYITYVPMHKSKENQRGYNQAKLLAEFLSKNVNIPIIDCLVKVQDTKNQVDLNYSDRQKNLLTAFKVLVKKEIKGKNILIIDDIYTTGATMNTCAKTLKSAGATKVFGLTIAHTVIDV